jgi:chorismate synthase
MSNTFGNLFRITTAGESHGVANVVIIDGLPPNIEISEEFIQAEVDRRKPGQSKLTTQRKEDDKVEILSGVFEGKSTGTPLAILIRNKDQRSKDYSEIKDVFRPGHADFTYFKKYENRDYRGGGRSSARETVARVAAGAVAKLFLQSRGVEVFSYTKQVGEIIAESFTFLSREKIDSNPVRCPDIKKAKEMENLIEDVRKSQDSIGGISETVILNAPVALGEPIFNRLRADLAHAMFSIPAVMGVEFGAGFDVAKKKGSENNDEFFIEENKVLTKTNNHGGILGGISSGMPIIFRCAVKPTSSISKKQKTINKNYEEVEISVKGRHDPCLLPRFNPVAEAMTWIVLADHFLMNLKK